MACVCSLYYAVIQSIECEFLFVFWSDVFLKKCNSVCKRNLTLTPTHALLLIRITAHTLLPALSHSHTHSRSHSPHTHTPPPLSFTQGLYDIPEAVQRSAANILESLLSFSKCSRGQSNEPFRSFQSSSVDRSDEMLCVWVAVISSESFMTVLNTLKGSKKVRNIPPNIIAKIEQIILECTHTKSGSKMLISIVLMSVFSLHFGLSSCSNCLTLYVLRNQRHEMSIISRWCSFHYIAMTLMTMTYTDLRVSGCVRKIQAAPSYRRCCPAERFIRHW